LKVTREESEAGAVAFIAGSVNGVDLGCRVARTTLYPVLGVPIVPKQVDSIDRFVQSFLELPSGVATFAVGRPGAINAALFAATVLSQPGSETRQALHQRREEQVLRVRAMRI
jgi:5-(carboxyamino)imidazole ribonucleotide mutase